MKQFISFSQMANFRKIQNKYFENIYTASKVKYRFFYIVSVLVFTWHFNPVYL